MDIVALFSSRLRALSLAPSLLVVIAFLFYFLLSRLLRRRRSGRKSTRLILFSDTLAFPAVLVVTLLLLNRYAHLAFTGPARLLLLSLLILTVAWLINRYLHSYFWSEHFEKRYGTPAPKILPNIVTVVLFLLAFYVILTAVFHRSISGLLVSTGVLVGVIGLALQNLISDFFYGFSITLEDPFHKGDWIEMSDGTLGQVIDISWHAIHLLSFNNSLYIVPNSSIARNTIHNLSRPDPRYAIWLTIAVDSTYPPEEIRRLLTEAALSCNAVLTDPPPGVNFADGSGNPYHYTVYIYFRNFVSHYRGKNDLYMAIHQRFERAGVHPSSVKYELATEEAAPRHYIKPSLREELAATDLLGPLSEADIELLASFAYEKIYRPGDTLLVEGDTDTSMVVITSGVVKVVKTGPHGRESELDRLGAGEVIGEMSLMTGQPRTATVRALVPVSCIIVPKEGLEPILERNPGLSNEIARIMVDRKMKDPTFSKRVVESPTPTSHLLHLYMERIGRRIADFFKIKGG